MEIKFRGLCINGEWVYGDRIKSGISGASMIREYNPDDEPPRWKEVNVIPKTVGQLTGLKDKESNEVYQGDIIENDSGRRCLVYWHEKSGQWDTTPLNDFGDAQGFENNRWYYAVRKIGNIHENQ